jgi:hypothetical protein
VQAFDVADPAVAKARACTGRHGVSVDFSVADADGFSWPDAACGGVAAIFVPFSDPDMRARLFERIVRSLKQGWCPGTARREGRHGLAHLGVVAQRFAASSHREQPIFRPAPLMCATEQTRGGEVDEACRFSALR